MEANKGEEKNQKSSMMESSQPHVHFVPYTYLHNEICQVTQNCRTKMRLTRTRKCEEKYGHIFEWMEKMKNVL